MHRVYILVVLCVMALSACSRQTDFSVRTYKDVERIFLHEPERWSFLIKGNDHLFTVRLNCERAIILRDVPKAEMCWVRVGAPSVHNPNFSLSLEIHIHSVKEINGAGWDHGKFGRGTTVVVE